MSINHNFAYHVILDYRDAKNRQRYTIIKWTAHEFYTLPASYSTVSAAITACAKLNNASPSNIEVITDMAATRSSRCGRSSGFHG